MSRKFRVSYVFSSIRLVLPKMTFADLAKMFVLYRNPLNIGAAINMFNQERLGRDASTMEKTTREVSKVEWDELRKVERLWPEIRQYLEQRVEKIIIYDDEFRKFVLSKLEQLDHAT